MNDGPEYCLPTKKRWQHFVQFGVVADIRKIGKFPAVVRLNLVCGNEAFKITCSLTKKKKQCNFSQVSLSRRTTNNHLFKTFQTCT